MWVVLGTVVSFTAGQRACILFIPIALCAITWLKLNRKIKLISACLLGVAAVLAFVFLLENSNIFSLSKKSNSVKIGHAIYYFKQLSIKQGLMGDGLGGF